MTPKSFGNCLLKTLGYRNTSKGETKVVLDIDGETYFDSNQVANDIN